VSEIREARQVAAGAAVLIGGADTIVAFFQNVGGSI
jgi:hypothetical protein